MTVTGPWFRAYCPRCNRQLGEYRSQLRAHQIMSTHNCATTTLRALRRQIAALTSANWLNH